VKTYYIIKRGKGETHRYLRANRMYGKTLAEAERFDNIRDAFRVFATLSTAQSHYEGHTSEIFRVEEMPGKEVRRVLSDGEAPKTGEVVKYAAAYQSRVASPLWVYDGQNGTTSLDHHSAQLSDTQGPAVAALQKHGWFTPQYSFIARVAVGTSDPVVTETVVA